MRAESCEIKSIKVLANPKLTQKINTDSAECELAIQTSNAEKKDLCIIVLSNGLPLEPHNQYLHYKLKEGAETTSPSAHALLSFQRFLTERNQTYQSLTEDPKEGVVFAYADSGRMQQKCCRGKKSECKFYKFRTWVLARKRSFQCINN